MNLSPLEEWSFLLTAEPSLQYTKAFCFEHELHLSMYMEEGNRRKKLKMLSTAVLDWMQLLWKID